VKQWLLEEILKNLYKKALVSLEVGLDGLDSISINKEELKKKA